MSHSILKEFRLGTQISLCLSFSLLLLMFKPLGLLSSLQCPTQSGSDGSECSSMRAHCPFSHKDSITSTSTSATCTSNSIKIKDSNGNVNHKQSDSILLPHSPPADPIQPILKKARNAYQPNQQNQQQQGAASSSSSSSSANKSSDGFTLVGAHKGKRVENGEQSGSNYVSIQLDSLFSLTRLGKDRLDY